MRISDWSSDVCSSDLQLQYADYPPLLIRAYMAAEDRTFFQHHGLDYPGIISAMITNLTHSGRPIGASTITQQVARSEEHTSELQSLMRISYAVFCLKKKNNITT